MIGRLFRMGLWLGLLGGIALALKKLLSPSSDDYGTEIGPKTADDQWRPLTRPAGNGAASEPASERVSESLSEAVATMAPPVERGEDEPEAEAAAEPEAEPAAEPVARVAATWVDPEGNICPGSHPIKGNAQSKIFHVPGGLSYDRTIPERCYESPEAAIADGFRRAKR